MCRGLWAEEQRVPVDTGRRDAASPTRGNYCQESEHLAVGRGDGLGDHGDNQSHFFESRLRAAFPESLCKDKPSSL